MEEIGECEACLAKTKTTELQGGYCQVCFSYDFCEYCENLFDPGYMVGRHCSDCHDQASGLA